MSDHTIGLGNIDRCILALLEGSLHHLPMGVLRGQWMVIRKSSDRELLGRKRCKVESYIADQIALYDLLATPPLASLLSKVREIAIGPPSGESATKLLHLFQRSSKPWCTKQCDRFIDTLAELSSFIAAGAPIDTLSQEQLRGWLFDLFVALPEEAAKVILSDAIASHPLISELAINESHRYAIHKLCDDSSEERARWILYANLRSLTSREEVITKLQPQRIIEELLVTMLKTMALSPLPVNPPLTDLPQHPFPSAFRQLAKSDDGLAKELAAKLGRELSLPWLTPLATISKEGILDLGETPITLDALTTVGSMIDGVKTIRHGPLVEEKNILNVRNCNHRLATSLMEEIRDDLLQIHLSSQTLRITQPLTPLLDDKPKLHGPSGTCEENKKPGRLHPFEKVQEITIDDPLSPEALPISIEQLNHFFQFFPSLNNLHLPPLRLDPTRDWRHIPTIQLSFIQRLKTTVRDSLYLSLLRGNGDLPKTVAGEFFHGNVDGLMYHHWMTRGSWEAWMYNYLQSGILWTLLNGAHLLAKVILPKTAFQIESNTSFSDQDLQDLLFASQEGKEPNRQRISHVFLRNNSLLTDRGFSSLLNSCPNLQGVNLESNPQLTDGTFLSLHKECLNKLRFLSLRGTNVSEAMVIELRRLYPQLTLLAGTMTFSPPLLKEGRFLEEKERILLMQYGKTASLLGCDRDSAYDLLEKIAPHDASSRMVIAACRDLILSSATVENIFTLLREAEDHHASSIVNQLTYMITIWYHPEGNPSRYATLNEGQKKIVRNFTIG